MRSLILSGMLIWFVLVLTTVCMTPHFTAQPFVYSGYWHVTEVEMSIVLMEKAIAGEFGGLNNCDL